MEPERISLDKLRTEGDVETQFLLPLLTEAAPSGLGISLRSIESKQDIRRYRIGKGSDLKVYFPDYLVVLNGIPLVVAEAKKRGKDVEEAFRESRLYAAELNASFDSGISPVSKVLATNGDRLLAGYADQALPIIDATFDELKPYSEKMEALRILIGPDTLKKEYDQTVAKLRPKRLYKPRRILGGAAIQDEPIGYNTFGATISADLATIFIPVTKEDRAKVVRKAYVTSRRRDRFVEPIDHVIRAATPLSEADAKLIVDTAKPVEIMGRISEGKKLEHKVLLLIGGVGSGKTTFVDYLQEVALPDEVKKSTVWLHVNMNDAPSAPDEIYNWVREAIISESRSENSTIDFDSLDGLKRLYAVDINKFHKGRGQLLTDERDYNRDLNALLKDLQADLHKTAISYCRFCGGDSGKLVIIVFDNCDKRDRDRQLLMFEVSQWVQKEFRALIVLPLREETYDNHRDEAPLDTAVKDLVFRIDAPPFIEVLTRRVQLALDELSSSQPKTYRYELPNSMHVEYAASDQAHYLSTILGSIFVHDRHLRRLMLGLTGRNLRRAFEIFLEFCNSGHIPESEILKIKRGNRYTIPIHVVLRVLLRMNRRYYDGSKSYIKNLFYSDATDKHPSYFTSLIILRWLHTRLARPGPTGLKGYFSVTDLTRALTNLGVSEDIALRELESLTKAQCVLTEDFRTSGLTGETLVRLAPAGLVHLDLVKDVTYWAAIAEDIFFWDEEAAKRILRHMSEPDRQYTVECTVFNALEAADFLMARWGDQDRRSSAILDTDSFKALAELGGVKAQIVETAQKSGIGNWLGSDRLFPPGSVHEVIVSGVQHYGFFADLAPGVTGLGHKRSNPQLASSPVKKGQVVRVKILDIDVMNKRAELQLAP